MSDTWFTSDFHLCHKNICKYSGRPFSSVEEMNEALIDNYNKLVKPEDTLIFLGDFAFCGTACITSFVARMNGEKLIIAGNHDPKPHVLERCGFKWATDETQYFHIPSMGIVGHTPNWDETNKDDIITLSHYPYSGDHTERERYLDRRPVDHGTFLWCGHVHEAWKISQRTINVGVDAWDFKPVHVEELLKLTEEHPWRSTSMEFLRHKR